MKLITPIKKEPYRFFRKRYCSKCNQLYEANCRHSIVCEPCKLKAIKKRYPNAKKMRNISHKTTRQESINNQSRPD